MRCLMLMAGERHVALPIAGIRRVAPAVAAVPLPQVFLPVEGVAAYGPDIVPQIDLAALLGCGRGGTVAVVAASGAGEVALRLAAAERVFELSTGDLEPVDAPGFVRGRLRHLRYEISLLDLSSLVIAAPPGRAAGSTNLPPPASTDRVKLPEAGGDEGPDMLACRVGGRLVSLPLGAIAAVERESTGAPALDVASTLGEGGGVAGRARVVLRLDDGELTLAVDEIVGLRGRGEAGTALDVDALVAHGRAEGLVMPVQPPPPAARRSMPLFLLAVGGRRILVPRSKVTRVGAVGQWRDTPPCSGRMSGIVEIGRRLLPALDLGGLLGMAPQRRPVVAAVDAEGSTWGFGCDAVFERSAPIEGRPVTVEGLPLLGEARMAEGLLPVLDVDRLNLLGAPT